VRGGFQKPRPANKPVALHPRRGASGLFPQTLRIFRKALVEQIDLIETTPLLHGALLSIRGWRERNRAFSSPIKAQGYAAITYKALISSPVLSKSAHNAN
jgi:hypothetical protein